jgi:hypothetical protein
MGPRVFGEWVITEWTADTCRHWIDTEEEWRRHKEEDRKRRKQTAAASRRGQLSSELVCGIYAIRNRQTGVRYVGLSTDIWVRIHSHRLALNRQRHINSLLQKDWSAFGEAGFEYEILELVADETQLLERERHWIIESIRGQGCYNYLQ